MDGAIASTMTRRSGGIRSADQDNSCADKTSAAYRTRVPLTVTPITRVRDSIGLSDLKAFQAHATGAEAT